MIISSLRELEIHTKLSQLDVAPVIIKIQKFRYDNFLLSNMKEKSLVYNKYVIDTVKYYYTLTTFCKKYDYTITNIPEWLSKKLLEKINIMHNNDIIHNNLNGNNILINPDIQDIRIIDFSQSQYTHEFNLKILSDSLLFENIDIKTIKKYEKNLNNILLYFL